MHRDHTGSLRLALLLLPACSASHPPRTVPARSAPASIAPSDAAVLPAPSPARSPAPSPDTVATVTIQLSDWTDDVGHLAGTEPDGTRCVVAQRERLAMREGRVTRAHDTMPTAFTHARWLGDRWLFIGERGEVATARSCAGALRAVRALGPFVSVKATGRSGAMLLDGSGRLWHLDARDTLTVLTASTDAPLHDAHFQDMDLGVAVQLDGTTRWTRDGGRHWEALVLPGIASGRWLASPQGIYHQSERPRVLRRLVIAAERAQLEATTDPSPVPAMMEPLAISPITGVAIPIERTSSVPSDVEESGHERLDVFEGRSVHAGPCPDPRPKRPTNAPGRLCVREADGTMHDVTFDGFIPRAMLLEAPGHLLLQRRSEVVDVEYRTGRTTPMALPSFRGTAGLARKWDEGLQFITHGVVPSRGRRLRAS